MDIKKLRETKKHEVITTEESLKGETPYFDNHEIDEMLNKDIKKIQRKGGLTK